MSHGIFNFTVKNLFLKKQVEILEDGEWSEKADYPIGVMRNLLVVKNSVTVYSIGGSEGGTDDAASYSGVPNTYRYNRLADTWYAIKSTLYFGGIAEKSPVFKFSA